MMNFTIIVALLGSLVALPSAAENNLFGGEENILLGMRVAQPTVVRDDLTPPKEVPSIYRAECGRCHVLYPPNLLTDGGAFSDKSGWKEIMDGLRNHYGENAELEDSVRLQIRRYLVDHAAASDRRFGSREDPVRLTGTPWFRRTHGTVKQYFGDARVRSPANCAACHPRAEHWNYARNEVRLPKVSPR